METGNREGNTNAASAKHLDERASRASLALPAAVVLQTFVLAYMACAASGCGATMAVLSAAACVIAVTAISWTGVYTIHRHARAAERLVAENRMLRDAAVTKDEFLAGVSHELRTPVNVVLGYVDLLLDHSFGPLEPAQRDILHRITKNASTLSHLINDLIDLSRIEAGRLKIEVATIELAPLFSDMRSLMNVLLAGHGISFHAELAPGCGRVCADPERLRQIVSNLLVNAVKFTESGSITLHAASCSPDALTISVTDTGIGIPANAHRAIFEPFRQVHDRSRHVPGAGIGLSISSRLARLMGGSLAVASEPGRGSCFTLTLPAVAADAAPMELAAEPLRRVC
jgi:signal transduction histidine kinase